MTAATVPALDGRRDLTALFSPSSIAIVGASNDPAKYGNWLAVRALRDQQYRRAVLINKTRSVILGHPAVPALSGLDEPVDLAVVAVPASAFDDAIEDAIAAKVKAIVAITAGLGEAGGDALIRQNALAARLRAAGIAMLGPNCLGVLDNTSGLDATVNEFAPGTVSIISQSGNVAIDVAEQLTDCGMGVSRFASLGNCADLDAADVIDSCVDHDGTEAIALYCEGFTDGRKFVDSAARAAKAGKPVVLLSVGRSSASARGAASHTGSMVTSSTVLEAVAEATGIELVSSPLEMVNLLQALTRTRPPRGPRVAVLADGGGHASLASDSLDAHDLRVECLSAELSADVAAELPATAGVSNPIDVAGGGEQDITCFVRTVQHLVDAPEVDAVLMTGYFGGFAQYDPAMRADEIQVGRDIGQIAADAGATLVAQTMFANSEAAQAMRDSGTAVYRHVEHATWALGRLAARHRRGPSTVPPLVDPAPAITEGGYWNSRRALAAAGIPFVAAAEVATVDALLEATTELGYPMVLKALGTEHKSDTGGVVLNIKDKTGLLLAWHDLQSRLAPPTCSIEQMANLTDAVELIVGVRRDPTFGPVVLVGIGGTYTELLHDTRCVLGPVTASQAHDLLSSLRGSALLSGYRGHSPVAVDAAAELIADLSHFAAAHPEIDEIECNPIAVNPTMAVALDARIILSTRT